MKRFRNCVGPQIATSRKKLGLTQEQLVAKMQLLGLSHIDRIGLSKIENQIRSVYDYELQVIASILSVTVDELFPALNQTKRDLPRLAKTDE
jgi:transcriptional regulator with XRE-family HTH domain